MTNQSSRNANQFDPKLATKVWVTCTVIAVLSGFLTHFLLVGLQQWNPGSAFIAGVLVFTAVFVVEVIGIVVFSIIKSINEPDEPY